MAKQPSTKKSQGGAPSGPSTAPTVTTDQQRVEGASALNPPNDPEVTGIAPNSQGQQGTDRHDDMLTDNTMEFDRSQEGDDEGDDEADQADRASLIPPQQAFPDPDDEEDPDAKFQETSEDAAFLDASSEQAEDEEEDPDEELLVRMVHEDRFQHVNGHPLESGTVIRMKRGDIKNHRERGVRMEDVNEDEFDGEVYDVSEPWKPEQDEEEAA